MNIRICPKCKDDKPEEEFASSKWCEDCRAKYHTKLVALGMKRQQEKAKALLDKTEVEDKAPKTPLERLVNLAKRSGTLRTQAIYLKNQGKWKQYYENEAVLQKEMKKWQH